MTLLAAIAAKAHTPTIHCFIAGRPYKAITTTVDHGYDSISSAVTLQIADPPSEGFQFRDEVEVWLGFDGFTIPVFKGFLEDDTKLYFPFTHEVRAAGLLKLAQYQYPGSLTYTSQTDEFIVEDLLTKAGITRRSIAGSSTTLGTVEDVVLRDGQTTFDLINLIDQTFGYKTFDAPDGVVHREAISGIPHAITAFDYEEGVDILAISNPRTIRGLHNRVVVVGLPLDTFTVGSTRQASNPLVPDPPKYITFEFRSDLIETDAIASVVAQRIIGEVNRTIEGFEIEVPGNPYLSPGMTVGVKAPTLGITEFKPQWVQHVSHLLDENGFITRLTLEGGIGGTGYEVNKPPIALFTFRITKETFLSGLVYTVTCDGSGSFDRDGPPEDLTFSWSNNKNGDTGTDPTYSTSFTQAQMDASPTITLAVTDALGATGTKTQPISGTADPVLTRELYVAVSSRAEASPDGGATWRTWTPGVGTVVSTPEIGAKTHSYFGLSNGELRKTKDWLLTVPILIHTFPAQVNAIWINEANSARVTVGLSNGQIWRSVNAAADAAATWTLLFAYGNAVQYLQESAASPGQYRVAVGNDIRITFNSFGSEGVLISFTGTAHHAATSAFANYGSATAAADVKREDGVEITGIASDDVRAITHHIRDDILWALDAAAQTYKKAAGGTTFAAVGLLPGVPGTAHHMIRDAENQLVIYAVADNGLYKTTDGAAVWGQLRDYSGVGEQGLQVGYGGFGALPTGPGQAIVLGRLAAGTIKIAQTTALMSASPTWTEVGSTGLPVADGSCQFFRDPWDPNDIAIIVARVAGGDELWRTTNLSKGSAATWTKVLDLAAVNTALGKSHTDLQIGSDFAELPALSYTIAEANFVIAMVYATGDAAGGEIVLVHSHVGGAGGVWETFYSTGPVVGGSPASNIILGQWSKDRVWYVNNVAALRGRRSDDHGHSDFIMAHQGYGPTGERIMYLFPYEGNESQQNLYYKRRTGGTLKNTGGGQDSAWFALTEDVDWTASQVAGWDHRSWNWRVNATTLGSSDDELSTKRTDTVTDVPDAVLKIALVRANLLMYADGARRVWTTPDWITTTERTGDLQSIFVAGSVIDVLSPSLVGSL